MNIIDVLEIAAGVILAKLMIGLLNESYWYKWERVRLEFNKLFSRRKRQTEEIKVPRSRKKTLEDYLP